MCTLYHSRIIQSVTYWELGESLGKYFTILTTGPSIACLPGSFLDVHLYFAEFKHTHMHTHACMHAPHGHPNGFKENAVADTESPTTGSSEKEKLDVRST